jgi:hypothetical protein
LTIDFATVNISGLTMRNGERAQGGGIYKTGTLTLINSTVSGNAASQGGGIYNGSGTLTLTNSTVSGNSAAEDGGGIFNPFFGLTIVTNSTVTGNAASNGGGGIFNDTGILTLTNSTVSGNSANSGGGIYNDLRDTKVFSSTIANNQAGGGVLSVGFGATVAFQNTILAGNLPYDCAGSAFFSGGNNLMGTQSCTVSGGGVTVADPMLGPLQTNGGTTETHALLSGSPAIDAGNPNGCQDDRGALLTTDQRGFPRPGDGNQDNVAAYDIGAYELFITGSTSVVAAILPSSRSVQVGVAATAFATVINTAQAIAVGCTIAPLTSVPASFVYQTTNPATNQITGTPNTPVNIGPGAAQTFVFAFTPTAPIPSMDVQLSFDCTNTNPAPINTGLNTLLLSASNTPVPDIVALAATTTNDGIVNIPGTIGTGAFAVATVNVGASGSITASADTGSATLPVNIFLCQTDPTNGQCISAIGPNVTTQINANATPTFGIFVQGNGNVPFDPAVNRIFVRFKDGGGVTRGSTSVAVRTQ